MEQNLPKEEFITENAAEPLFGFQMQGPVTLTNVHNRKLCEGQGCAIHHPSDHHMKDWPLNWRGDRRIMERICIHGVGHPDPDDQAYLHSIGRTGEGVHGCDLCC